VYIFIISAMYTENISLCSIIKVPMMHIEKIFHIQEGNLVIADTIFVRELR